MEEAIRKVHPRLNDSGFFDWYEDNNDWNWNEFYKFISYRGLDKTEKGKEYYTENQEDISMYENGAEAFSTKNPNCDE